ncbi:hypothetical protein SDC9_152405 [bioreactor metagenome]|uniref:Uncharacterized protein n=1 Tax=bioreactor metagenome TaxID=1076179 RepID=A0A645ET12_9ZZZZ
MHIRILYQKGYLFGTVIGVHRHRYSSDLRSGIQESQPIGHVLRPDPHITTPGDSNGNQPFCHIIHSLIEIIPGKTQVTIGIDNIFFIWCLFYPIFQPVSQRPVRKLNI